MKSKHFKKHKFINMKDIMICGGNLNILEITEDKIFQVLGKGRDPKFKPIDKASLKKKDFEPFDFSRLLE